MQPYIVITTPLSQVYFQINTDSPYIEQHCETTMAIIHKYVPIRKEHAQIWVQHHYILSLQY